MRIIFILLMFCTTLYADNDFYDFENAHIEVLPFSEELISSDVYIRAFKDIESKFPRYFFKFNNFPSDEEITVSIQRVAQKEKEAWKPIYHFRMRPSGMIIDNGDPIGFMLCFSSQGCLLGERVSFAFETESGFYQAVSFIPNPLTLKSRKGNALIKAELISLNPTFFQVEFPGLKPKEKVKISSESLGECLAPFKHDASKLFIYSPDVVGYSGGTALMTVHRTTQKFKMEFPWGNELLRGYGTPCFFRP